MKINSNLPKEHAERGKSCKFARTCSLATDMIGLFRVRPFHFWCSLYGSPVVARCSCSCNNKLLKKTSKLQYRKQKNPRRKIAWLVQKHLTIFLYYTETYKLTFCDTVTIFITSNILWIAEKMWLFMFWNFRFRPSAW